MLIDEKGDSGYRFRYHAPVPNFYKKENPKNPLKVISKEVFDEFKRKAYGAGFKGLCYSELNKEDLNQFQKDSKHVILLKFPISASILEMIPSKNKFKAIDNEFQSIAHKLFDLADFLRDNGFACELINPVADDLSIRELAIKSNEAIITRSNMCLFEEGLTMGIFALASSIENLPKNEINNLLWVKKYCSTCGKCISNCPYDAYDTNEKIISKKCLAHREGCNVCIIVCPFFKKDINIIKQNMIKRGCYNGK